MHMHTHWHAHAHDMHAHAREHALARIYTHEPGSDHHSPETGDHNLISPSCKGLTQAPKPVTLTAPGLSVEALLVGLAVADCVDVVLSTVHDNRVQELARLEPGARVRDVHAIADVHRGRHG